MEAPFFPAKNKIFSEEIQIPAAKIQILAARNRILAAKISHPSSDLSIFASLRYPEGAPKSSNIITPELIKFATSHRHLAPLLRLCLLFLTSTNADTTERTPFHPKPN